MGRPPAGGGPRGAPRPALGADTRQHPRSSRPSHPSSVRSSCEGPRPACPLHWGGQLPFLCLYQNNRTQLSALQPWLGAGALRLTFIFTTALCSEHACQILCSQRALIVVLVAPGAGLTLKHQGATTCTPLPERGSGCTEAPAQLALGGGVEAPTPPRGWCLKRKPSLGADSGSDEVARQTHRRGFRKWMGITSRRVCPLCAGPCEGPPEDGRGSAPWQRIHRGLEALAPDPQAPSPRTRDISAAISPLLPPPAGSFVTAAERMEPCPPTTTGDPFPVYALTCSSTAFNAKASACVSARHTPSRPARSLPESAPSAHRETEVSGNLCCSKGGLWRGYRQSRAPSSRLGDREVTCSLSGAPHMGSSRGTAGRAGDGQFKDEHSSGLPSRVLLQCDLVQRR